MDEGGRRTGGFGRRGEGDIEVERRRKVAVQ